MSAAGQYILLPVKVDFTVSGSNTEFFVTNETPWALRPVTAGFIDAGGLTANATNHVDISGEIGSTEFFSFETDTTGNGGTGDIAADTRFAITLSATPDLDPAGKMVIKVTKTGNGVTVNGTVTVFCEAIR